LQSTRSNGGDQFFHQTKHIHKENNAHSKQQERQLSQQQTSRSLSKNSIFAARLSLLHHKSSLPSSAGSRATFSTINSATTVSVSNKGQVLPVPAPSTARDRATGAFVKVWPTVYPGDIHYRRAYRKTMKTIAKDVTIKNERNAQRKYAAQLFDQLMKALTVPITECIDIYGPRTFRDKLHPYEATVANLTITARMKAGNYDLQVTSFNMIIFKRCN
jgi:hypothetical protein